MQLLLTLLRILGILILAVILLVLLVVLLVLLVPIRYQVWAESKEENSLYAKVRIHWLLHLISLTAEYREELIYRLKILGITVLDEKKASTAERTGDANEPQPEANDPIIPKEPGTKWSPVKPEILKVEKKAEKDSITDSKTEPQSTVAPDSDTPSTQKKSFSEKAEDIWIKVMEFISNIPEKIAALLEKWADFQENIGERVDALLGKIEELNRKKDRLMRQLQDEQNQFAVKEIFKTLGKLLKHIRPGKLKIKGRLGFDDPAQTGQVFGIIGMLMPLYGEHIQLEAVFDEKIMEGDLYLGGRIRLGTLAWFAIRLVMRREVRRLISQVRRLTSEFKNTEMKAETKASQPGNDKK